jgi:hypothetical protein
MAKYGKKSQKTVKKAIHEMKKGELETGTGKKVKNRKQAIAIGLSEARKEGAKVPPPPSKKSVGQRGPVSKKKSSGKKSKPSAKSKK